LFAWLGSIAPTNGTVATDSFHRFSSAGKPKMLTDVTEQKVRSDVFEVFVESADDHFGERMASRKKGGMQLVVR
jgi:hypothetical protein